MRRPAGGAGPRPRHDQRMRAAIRIGCATILVGAAAALPGASTAAARCGGETFSADNSPGACWRPFSAASPFNVRLPQVPRQTLDSLLIATRFGGYAQGPRFQVGNADTPTDYGHPIYFNRPANPLYRIDCTAFGGQCGVDGHRIQIPNQALPAGGDDGHLAVIDQERGWEYDFWQVTEKPRGGRGKLRVGWGGRTPIGTADAEGLGAGATAAGFALSAGVSRPAELRTGEIDHALFITVPCTNGTAVWPAGRNPGGVCSSTPSELGAPAMGQRLYLEMTATEIDVLAVPAWQKTILRAMAEYGMFVGDTGGPANGWEIKVESGSSFTSFGKPDPWVKLANRYGLIPQLANDGTHRYSFDLSTAVDWAHELRVAAPCVSHRRC